MVCELLGKLQLPVKHRKTFMKNSGFFTLFLVLIFFCSPGFASSEWAGMNSAQFLKISIGARQAAMGEAFSAVADDISSMYWNPAGLVQIQEKEIVFSHAFWLGYTSYDFLAYSRNLKGPGVFGAGISSLFYGNLAGMDDSGNSIPDFSAYDILGILSYARNLSKSTSFGLNLKLIQQVIEKEGAGSWAVDAGLLFKSNTFKNLTLACVFQNIGPGLKIINECRPLPYSTRFAASCKFFNDCLTIAADADIPSSQDASIHIGVEYWQEDVIAFRIGYKTSTFQDLGFLSCFSIGMGYRQVFGTRRNRSTLNIDYAFVPCGDLVGAHRISFLLKF